MEESTREVKKIRGKFDAAGRTLRAARSDRARRRPRCQRRSPESCPLPDDDLATRLAAIYADRPNKSVMLAADRTLPYAPIVEIMDACRAAGIARIGIVTSPLPPNK